MYLEKYNYKTFFRNKIFKSTFKATPNQTKPKTKHKWSQNKLIQNYQSKR